MIFMYLQTYPTATPMQFGHQNFSPEILEKFKSQYANMSIWIDDKFHKTFMRLIDNSSVNDAKQIIHIHNFINGRVIDFTYKSEYDILVELYTTVKSLADPIKDLEKLFQYKTEYLFPVDTHSWIMQDLDAILFFLNILFQFNASNQAYKGGEEIIASFQNFIQFNVIHFDWNNFILHYQPIQFLNQFNKYVYFQQYEQYKKWYLEVTKPRKEFRWLEKCSDSQLDTLIDNLEKNNLRILKNIFHPVTESDKISLIIASLNSILFQEDRVLLIDTPRNQQPVYHKLSGNYNLSILYNKLLCDWVIISKADIYKPEHEVELYEYIAIPRKLISAEEDAKSQMGLSIQLNGDYPIHFIHREKTVVKGRNSYIKQFYEAARQKRHRDSQSVSKEECTIKILKKICQF